MIEDWTPHRLPTPQQEQAFKDFLNAEAVKYFPYRPNDYVNLAGIRWTYKKDKDEVPHRF